MKIRDFKYLFKEGFKNIWVNGMMSLASIGTVLACLIILGIFVLFSLNVNNLAKQLKAQYEIVAIVDENVPDETLDSITDQIEQVPNVASVTLVTKDEALSELEETLDDSDILEGLDENPLRSSYKISLSDLSAADGTASQIEQINGIVKVDNNKDLTDKILNVTNIIKIITFWIFLLLIIMTVFIISNTVKVAMFARRKEVNIMKFIGATDWFIRLPFMLEGIIIGILGSILAFLVVFNTYVYIYNTYASTYSYLLDFVTAREAAVYMGVLFLTVGAVMGFFGSFMSIRKHLKV